MLTDLQVTVLECAQISTNIDTHLLCNLQYHGMFNYSHILIPSHIQSRTVCVQIYTIKLL